VSFAAGSWREWLAANDHDAPGFTEHCRAVTRRNVRNGAVVGAVLTTLAWPLDLLVDTPTARALAVFRVASVALALVYGVSFWMVPALSKRPQLAWSGVVAVALFGCVCNAARARLDLPWIDHTYLLPFVTLLGLETFGRRLISTAVVTTSFVVFYFVLFRTELGSPHAWPFVIIMSIATLVSVTVGHSLYVLSARQFTLTSALARAKLELEEQVAWQTRELEQLNVRATKLHAAERHRVAEVLGGQTEGLVERMQIELRTIEPGPDPIALARVVGLADELRASTHRIVWDLGPQALDEGELAASLERLVATMRPLSAAELRAEIDGGLVGLDRRVAWTAYRVAQEALNNAMRHASATSIVVRAARRGSGMTLEIRDDGVGFEEAGSDSRRGLGLASMRDRAARLGGTLSIDSRVGAGTLVTLVLAIWADIDGDGHADPCGRGDQGLWCSHSP
jgi:signal transduction histidine kinase